LRRRFAAHSPLIFVVDDDDSFRNALGRLLTASGFKVEAFPTAQAFLGAQRPDVPSCLLLDVQLSGLGGLDLQRELHAVDAMLPIIFLAGHGDIPMSVQAMKAGSADSNVSTRNPNDDKSLLTERLTESSSSMTETTRGSIIFTCHR
jgi:FixJ family two-component response regulator